MILSINEAWLDIIPPFTLAYVVFISGMFFSLLDWLPINFP
jgi:hypothetical protein